MATSFPKGIQVCVGEDLASSVQVFVGDDVAYIAQVPY